MHLDVKPDNVMLLGCDRAYTVGLTDLGLSKQKRGTILTGALFLCLVGCQLCTLWRARACGLPRKHPGGDDACVSLHMQVATLS